MRALLILISLFLVGCSELESELENAVSEIENLGTSYKNEPKFTKEPTYLKCANSILDSSFFWIVIDHENQIFIEGSDEKKPTEEYNPKYVTAQPLTTSETHYGYMVREYKKGSWKVNRAALTFTNGYITHECEVTDDLSELRAIGVEKARPKI